MKDIDTQRPVDPSHNGMNPWVLHIIPNTHWDREWYMSFERFRLRLVKLMDRLLDLFNRDPEFRAFTLDGQFIPVRDYLELRPEREEDVKRLVREGRLLIGPWYTQPLETLAGGEGLVRNLMLGIRESRRFGASMMISYVIDEFGHVSQLPQILRGFGIESAMAWRGVPPGMKSVFRWQSPDGSDVLFFHSNGGYGEATALPENMDDFTQTIEDTAFQRPGLRTRIRQILELRAPRSTTRELLALNGIDHAFVQENLTELIRRINTEIREVHAIHSDLVAFTEAVKAAHAREGIPYQVWSGELYDDNEAVLEPIHSFRAELKIANDRLEGLLVYQAEPLAAIAWALGRPYPSAALARAWEFLLQNHSHDSVGCSSADSVYRDIMNRYERAEDIARELIDESMQWLALAVGRPVENAAAGKTLLLFNPLSWAQTGTVSTQVDIPLALGFEPPAVSEAGRLLPSQVESRTETLLIRYNPQRGHTTTVPTQRTRLIVEAGAVPPLGYRAVTLRNGTAPVAEPGLAVASDTVENRILRITAQSNGTLDVLDKSSGRVLAGLLVFEDGGESGSGYDYIPPTQDRLVRSDAFPASVQVEFNSPLKATLRIESVMTLPAALAVDRKSRGGENVDCRLVSRVTLTQGSPRVDIETTVDNRAKDHRLRVLFPSGLPGATHACAEQPFDVVARPIAKPMEPARPGAPIITTKPQQSFVDVSDGKAGLMIANQGLYEYEVIDDAVRTVALTLLRCIDRLDAGGSVQPLDFVMPLGQSPGLHTFRYSIIPHGGGGWRESCREAWAFKYPVQAVLQRHPEESVLPGYTPPAVAGTLPECHSFVQLGPDPLIVSSFKKHETRDTLVLRVWNSADEPVTGQVSLSIPDRRVIAAWATDLSEERQGSLAVSAGGEVPVVLRPRGLLTVEFQLD